MLVRLNLLLLMVVSFIPFPTRLLAEYGGDDDADRVATTIYGLTIFAAVVLTSVVWRYAVGARLVRTDAADEHIADLTSRLTPGLAGYVVMLVRRAVPADPRRARLSRGRDLHPRAVRAVQASIRNLIARRTWRRFGTSTMV